jgi:hypothetical protein
MLSLCFIRENLSIGGIECSDKSMTRRISVLRTEK